MSAVRHRLMAVAQLEAKQLLRKSVKQALRQMDSAETQRQSACGHGLQLCTDHTCACRTTYCMVAVVITLDCRRCNLLERPRLSSAEGRKFHRLLCACRAFARSGHNSSP